MARRTPNFNYKEEEILLNLVKKYSHILENKRTDHLTSKQKIMCWEKIVVDFNAHPNVQMRTSANLKNKYENIKKTSRKKMAGHKKFMSRTGGEPALPENISDGERELTEKLGPQVNGLHHEFDDVAPAIEIFEENDGEVVDPSKSDGEKKMINVVQEDKKYCNSYCSSQLGEERSILLREPMEALKGNAYPNVQMKTSANLKNKYEIKKNIVGHKEYMSEIGGEPVLSENISDVERNLTEKLGSYDKGLHHEFDDDEASTVEIFIENDGEVAGPSKSSQLREERSIPLKESMEALKGNDREIADPLQSIENEMKIDNAVQTGNKNWNSYNFSQLREKRSTPLRHRPQRPQFKDKLSLWAQEKVRFTQLQKIQKEQEFQLNLDFLKEKHLLELKLIERKYEDDLALRREKEEKELALKERELSLKEREFNLKERLLKEELELKQRMYEDDLKLRQENEERRFNLKECLMKEKLKLVQRKYEDDLSMRREKEEKMLALKEHLVQEKRSSSFNGSTDTHNCP